MYVDEATTEDRIPPSVTQKLTDDRGAVGTEMAIVVAIVVAIAIALGVVMTNSANSHQECIPENRGDAVPADCART